MASIGDLTRSGLLYEGSDFKNWEDHVRTVLRVQGVENELHEYWFPGCSDARKDVCNTLLSYTYPALRRRISNEVQPNPGLLLERLRRFAQPFRFLVLPPELQNRVYEYVVAEDNTTVLSPLTHTTTGHPSITQLSRQTRAEAMPVFYARCTFKIDFTFKQRSLAAKLKTLAIADESIKASLKQMSTAYLRHLRTVHLQLHFERDKSFSVETGTLATTFSHVAGLSVELLDKGKKLLDSSEIVITKHIKKTEETRKLLGLQGEAILLALTSNDGLWKVMCLRLARSTAGART